MAFGWLMVIDDFDFVSVGFRPAEDDAPLVVDSDALPSGEVAFEGFEQVAGWHSDVFESSRGVQLNEFA